MANSYYMRLFYIANIRFPTERAHGVQVAHMCAAFARAGAEVTLLVPNRQTFGEDPYDYYGIPHIFRIEKISAPDTVRLGVVGFLLESLVFACRAARQVYAERDAVVYTREELPLLFLPRGRAFYEAHQLRKGFFFRMLMKRAKGIVSISRGLKDALVGAGFPEGKILVAHDGYDERQFAARISKTDARQRLGLPQDKKIALYIGGLESWKGAETLCMAAEYLAKADVLVTIIGGAAEEVQQMREKYPMVKFLGSRPYRELSQNQQVADILVVPNSAKTKLGSQFTSPLKLFAHMVSGVALAAAEVPALMEIVGATQVFLFRPDDPFHLAKVLELALSSDSRLERKAKAVVAEKRAADFTWDKRAEEVLAFIND